MTGMHLLQGLDFSVVQGGDILHRVCSLSIGWTKAHWDTLRGSTQSSGAILSKSNWLSYQNLCPGTYISVMWTKTVVDFFGADPPAGQRRGLGYGTIERGTPIIEDQIRINQDAARL